MNTFFTIFGYALITLFIAFAGVLIIDDAREKNKRARKHRRSHSYTHHKQIARN